MTPRVRLPLTSQRARLIAVATMGVALLALGGTAVALDRDSSKAPIPNEAIRADGTIDVSQVPDFIPAYGRDGQVAGYVPKTQLGFDDSSSGVGTIPVYADDLTRLVGHMVPNVGFVPLGTDPAALPTFRIEASTETPAPDSR